MLKKSMKFLLVVIFGVLMLFGCSKDEKLDTPSNFSINGTVASWDAVVGATKYRLDLVKDGSSMKRMINDTSVDLATLDLAVGTYTVNVQAVGDGSNDSEYTTSNLKYEQKNLNVVNELVGESLLDSLYVKWNGRTLYNEEKALNMVYHSASGFEVKFIGSKVTSRLYATNYNDQTRKPYVVIVLDDNFDNMVRIDLTEKYTDLVLVEGITDGLEHKVTLYKSTESTDSHIGVEKISTDGEFVQGIDIRDRKIEFIAASSSTGYGNLAKNANEGKNTTNSDCMQAFAAITARTLNADFNIFSASGWGVKASAYTSAGENLFNAYKNVDFRGEAKDIKYSFSNFTPDVVVVNLGTNDYSYANAGATEAQKLARLNEFKEQYMAFIEYIHAVYPNAHIVLFHGLMNENVAIANLTNEMYELLLPTVKTISIIKVSGDGQGSAYHPSVASHKAVAKQLVAHIKENVGWE